MGFWDSVRTGTLSVTGTIYELADTVTLGALPNTLQGVQISNVGAKDSLAAQAAAGLDATAQQLGNVPVSLAAPTIQYLPTVGTALGQGVGNLGYYSLTGVGAGAGNAISSVGGGAGDLFGDVGKGLGKGLLPIALIVFGGLLLLILATRGRSIKVGQGGGSLT